MEHKKNPMLDLRKWSGTLFNLGLAVSLGAVLVAFEWKAKNTENIKTFEGMKDDWDEIEIPVTIQTPPPPPPPPVPIEVNTVPDEIKIEKIPDFKLDLNATEQTNIPEVEITEAPVKEDVDVIEDFVEAQAMFKGGMDAWYAYLNKNLKYPAQAKRIGIEGTVIVRFVVNTDGSIQDIELVRTIGGGCDEIAKEVIENSPNWNPGRIGGRVVRSRMTMPIRFKLN
ncbi:outer membrane transport energization protein TonB [Algoriphagus locisalis]|uniref:Outer membrane transport energization protein TonB n=1 Tax=Algoriphagus locisalis TaxID=305507 RepID=A0A1I7E1V2_9BACT|nr:energy transducer TonB [Algoriphagus locisalis]SFU17910.1 outer membrane transport energization protein TonB [Algoriphagus locisalis]